MAILSSGFVKQVGNSICWADTALLHYPAQRHPAVADKIHLGIALSNLNGFDYTINLANIQAAKFRGESGEFFHLYTT